MSSIQGDLPLGITRLRLQTDELAKLWRASMDRLEVACERAKTINLLVSQSVARRHERILRTEEFLARRGRSGRGVPTDGFKDR